MFTERFGRKLLHGHWETSLKKNLKTVSSRPLIIPKRSFYFLLILMMMSSRWVELLGNLLSKALAQLSPWFPRNCPASGYKLIGCSWLIVRLIHFSESCMSVCFYRYRIESWTALSSTLSLFLALRILEAP